MKTTFIHLKSDKIEIVLNSEHVKSIGVTNNNVTINTASWSYQLSVVDAVQKIKKKVQQYYGIVELSDNQSHFDSHGAKNNVLILVGRDYDAQHSVAIIFPKGLKSIAVNNNKISVSAIGIKHEVTFSDNATAMKNFSKLETWLNLAHVD